MEQVLLNLLRYPPVEGSIASHEAWKQNVRICLVRCGTDAFWIELQKGGYVSQQCRNEARSYYINRLLPKTTG